MNRMARTGKSLAELANVMTRLPQVLINVRDVDKTRADTDPQLNEAVAQAAMELGSSGRVLLRPSGTESVVRVMVEAQTADEAGRIAEQLAAVVKETLGPVGSGSAH
jgi:phosphoglucosamine mutase